jgi:hypothetical protein
MIARERLGPSVTSGSRRRHLTSTTVFMAPKDALQLASEAENPLEYEQSHVHEVYESIAEHFSATRYKV